MVEISNSSTGKETGINGKNSRTSDRSSWMRSLYIFRIAPRRDIRRRYQTIMAPQLFHFRLFVINDVLRCLIETVTTLQQCSPRSQKIPPHPGSQAQVNGWLSRQVPCRQFSLRRHWNIGNVLDIEKETSGFLVPQYTLIRRSRDRIHIGLAPHSDRACSHQDRLLEWR